MKLMAVLTVVAFAFACEAKEPTITKTQTIGPLKVGGDYKSYKKANKTPVRSVDHGKRFVDTYVNEVGWAAYTDKEEEMDFPVGTIIVKTSWEAEGDKPSQIPGPTFVMKKMEAGYAPDRKDWYYAIHWEKPQGSTAKQHPNGLYWQSPEPKVKYCWGCHEGYERQVGLIPEAARAY